MRQLWLKLPVIVRAVIVGSAISTFGHIPASTLLYTNLKIWSAVPWSLPFVVLYFWFFWQYLNGRWWPSSTAETRRRDLRAPNLPAPVWRWALIAGGLAMAALMALHGVLAPVTPPTYEVYYPLFRDVPPLTLAVFILALSTGAGIVEEAAYRGYMQGPIERRHGPVIAIAVVTLFFVQLHFTAAQKMSGPRILFITVASLIYGILVHLSGSIVPGIILHAAGDAFGLFLLWFVWAQGATRAHPAGFAAAMRTPTFWLNVAEGVILTTAAVWAFRKLKRAATAVRLPAESPPAQAARTR
ncbi:MAG TPA: CPBP family intramembrane glutamic endopeptidase [Thermoanaerobaculia bacterium]|nr:CPBP family intramembrane glutamic endopeptidase [Thermoanaerobaculia bacterium]